MTLLLAIFANEVDCLCGLGRFPYPLSTSTHVPLKGVDFPPCPQRVNSIDGATQVDFKDDKNDEEIKEIDTGLLILGWRCAALFSMQNLERPRDAGGAILDEVARRQAAPAGSTGSPADEKEPGNAIPPGLLQSNHSVKHD
jgi:hypothetical protein